MTREKINEYTVRISGSSRGELVAISCEIAVDYMKDAKQAMTEHDLESAIRYLNSAKAFVEDLSGSLDMKYPISGNLLSLYNYVHGIILKSKIRKNDENLDNAIEVMREVGKAFKVAAEKEEVKERTVQGGEEIYTGFTYGKNSKLNEYVVRN